MNTKDLRISEVDGHRTVILVADDDPDDRLLTSEAWEEARSDDQLIFVEDGQMLLEYLEGCHTERCGGDEHPCPDLLLLDLNMPKLDGLSALRIIKNNETWRTIPVVILTTSRDSSDIATSYAIGANSYITKPTTYRELVDMVATVGNYWAGVVALPTSAGA